MFRAIKGRTLLALAIAAAALFTLLVLSIPARYLVEIMNGVFIGIVAAVCVVFIPLMLRATERKPALDPVDYMTLGIMAVWAALIGSRVLSIIVSATNASMRDRLLPFIALVGYVIIIGGVLMLKALGTVEDKWRYNKGLVILAVIFGLFVGGATIYIQRVGINL